MAPQNPTRPSFPPGGAQRFEPRHFPPSGGGGGGGQGSGKGGGQGGGRRPPPRAKKRGGLFLGVAYLFLFVFIAAATGVGYLAFNPPSDLIRQKIAEQVKAKTGRDLVMAGPASFLFFPSLGISLQNVSLSGPPGMDGKLVSMQSLDVSVKALTLLSRQVEIDTLSLRKPVFDLRIDKTGRNNWKFAAAAAATGANARFAELLSENSARDYDPIQIAAADDQPAGTKFGRLADVRLNDVRVEDGTFKFTDERTGKTEEAGSINAKLGLPSLGSPLSANGNLAWRGETINFEGNIPDVPALIAAAPAHISFAVKSAKLDASYNGGLLIKDGVYLDGQVAAQSASARDLAHWFGTALPPVSGFGPLSIQGVLKTRGNVTTFSGAQFSLDGATAKGTITVTTGGVRPLVDADLAISELDVNKYVTSAVTAPIATEDESPPPPVAEPRVPSPPGSPDAQPNGIQKLLDAPATKVYGAVQRAGWSSERLNLTLLGIADGNARLNVGKLLFKKLQIGQSDLTITVKDRAMSAIFVDVALYQGRGKGQLVIDGAGSAPALKADFALEGISAQPFLHDAAGFDRLAGSTNVDLKLAATGSSQLQLVENLNGTAAFTFTDGAIVGFNVPGTIRSLSHGDLSGLKAAPSAKTDFASMQATFALTNGVAENHDLKLLSPLLRAVGSGNVHLVERTIDYTLKPKVVASLEGQATDNGEASGIEVPVRITGSWDSPRYEPQLQGILGDKTTETIKEIGKQLKGKSAGEIVNDLFGKSKDDADGTEPKSSARDLLKKLFKSPQDNN